MALNLKHQTAAQFAERLRERYRTSEREDAARIAKWLLSAITAGDITDAQVRSAFDLTTTQWTALKSKMQTLVDNYNAVQSARGE